MGIEIRYPQSGIPAIDLKPARKCKFMRGLTAVERDDFIKAGRIRRVPKDTYLFHQDDPADVLYVVLSGKIRLAQVTAEGDQVIVHHAGPGGCVGIIVALSDMTYPVSGRALEDSALVCWDALTTKQFMLRCPQLALNGLEMVAEHFVRAQDRYRELATERVEQRVARALLRLARHMGKKVDAGVLIDMPLSRQNLAEMAGTTLYTVSRILRKWEASGCVSIGRERVVLKRPHDLVVIADNAASAE